jgi:hypothetical protein
LAARKRESRGEREVEREEIERGREERQLQGVLIPSEAVGGGGNLAASGGRGSSTELLAAVGEEDKAVFANNPLGFCLFAPETEPAENK